MKPMPQIRYVHGPCERCGARDLDEADRLCRPESDQTGERYCDGRFNEHGMSEVPTPESLAELDAWCLEQAKLDDAPHG